MYSGNSVPIAGESQRFRFVVETPGVVFFYETINHH